MVLVLVLMLVVWMLLNNARAVVSQMVRRWQALRWVGVMLGDRGQRGLGIGQSEAEKH